MMHVDTRSRSGSVQFDDLKDLLLQLEERLTDRISDVCRKIDGIEKSIESIQTNQVRLDNEMNKIKNVILEQQKFIERIEAEKRKYNVIVQGIPESDVSVDGVVLKSDSQKVDFLTAMIDDSDRPKQIDSTICLRRPTYGQNRQLLI